MHQRVPALLIALVAITILASLWWPMGRDQGIYAWIGSVILDGGLPYTDAFGHKGPAVYLHYAAVQAVLGRGMWAIRLADGLLLIAGAVAAAGIAASVAGRTAGLWAGALTGLTYFASTNTFWNTAEPDGFAAMLAIIAAALMAYRRWPWAARVIASALLVGFLSLYKPPLHLLFALPVLLCLRLDREAASRRDYVTAGALWMAAALVPVVAATVWLWHEGALGEALSILFVFNPAAHTGIADAGRLVPVFEEQLRLRLPVLVLAVPGIAYTWRDRRPLSVALGLWLLLALGAIALQGKFYQYQWQLLAPAAAVAAGIAIGRLLQLAEALPERLSDAHARAVRWGVIAMALAACIAGRPHA